MSGEAFNRMEVSSEYVEPGHRFVVSLVVGTDVDTPEEALRQAMDLACGPCRHDTVWVVHDRMTGETLRMCAVEVAKVPA